jgi:protein-disulfide isomerase
VQAGASRGKVADGITHGGFQQWVKNGTSQASKAGITATPTVKIDGKSVEGASVADLATQVERAVDQGS